jgi:alkyl sulfatase BDS1-like metallo-beta-lactamase superfamily hydrolase
MANLLDLSARFVDEGVYEGPTSVNRMSTELSEVGRGVSFIEAFSNVVSFDSGGDGLVVFDASLEMFGPAVLASLRGWSKQPVHSLCYTHGHIDHIGGAGAFLTDAEQRGHPTPAVIGHRGVLPRFERYERTNGYNGVINRRQFATLGGGVLGASAGDSWGPSRWVAPDKTFDQELSLEVGDLTFELRHARGETDDHLWAWVPARKAVVVGDFVAWVFPNAGNPQKVQRYPAEWARALREMAALEPELMLPAHGLPVAGAQRVKRVLGDIASVLESLVTQTLALMNEGATLDECLHSVHAPADLLERPYLRPVYDEPEFIVRNIWRLYGGWYDGNPAHLKPPRDADFASEIASLVGSATQLAERAVQLATSDLRLACSLVELAFQAAPGDAAIHAIRAQVYQQRRDDELSLMAKGIYTTAARDSKAAIRDLSG